MKSLSILAFALLVSACAVKTPSIATQPVLVPATCPAISDDAVCILARASHDTAISDDKFAILADVSTYCKVSPDNVIALMMQLGSQ